jgi:hypothetical protein
MMVYRIAWHAGFGGTGTAETAHPAEFIRKLHRQYGHLDWVSPFGAYETDNASPTLGVARDCRPW